MKKVLVFIGKSFRWLIPAACLLFAIVLPHKPFFTFVAGMCSIGFLFSAYYLYLYWQKYRKINSLNATTTKIRDLN